MFKKFLFLAIAAFGALAFVPSQSHADRTDIQTWTGQGARRGQVEVRISSDGVVHVSSESVTKRMTYQDGAKFNLSGSVYSASAGTTIPHLGMFMMLDSTGNNIAMTASPQIATATARHGDVLTLMNASTDTIILSGVAGAGLRLTSSPTSFGPGDTLELIFNVSSGSWLQKGGSNNP